MFCRDNDQQIIQCSFVASTCLIAVYYILYKCEVCDVNFFIYLLRLVEKNLQKDKIKVSDLVGEGLL